MKDKGKDGVAVAAAAEEEADTYYDALKVRTPQTVSQCDRHDGLLSALGAC